MKTAYSITAFIAAMSVASSATAQNSGDWYASIFGGFSYAEGESTISEEFADYYFESSEFDLSIESDSGFALGATLGKSLSRNLRAEAELSFASYTVGTVAGISSEYDGVIYDVSGDDVEASATYLMGNLWYDLNDPTGGSGVTPYVGGGIGVARVTGTLDGDDLFDPATGFAYQIGAGVQVPAGAGIVDIGYRYKGVAGLEIEGASDYFGEIPSNSFEDTSLTSSTFQAAYVISF